jgi:nicotinamide-nucleotide amidase
MTVRAAVLSIGSELLLGDLTDSNATWISTRLRERAVDVVHHLAARDDIDEIVGALHWLAERVDLIIVGGGLGPTSDDLTREAVARAVGVELELREDLEEAIIARFAARGRAMAPRNRRQAFVPMGARACLPAGTAPGFATDLAGPHGSVRIIALPGVPWEIHELWPTFVAPQLVELGAVGVTVTRIVHVAARGESDVAAVVEPLLDGVEGVTLAFLAKKFAIHVRLTASGRDHADALARTQPAVDAVVAALGSAVTGVDADDLETVVMRLLIARGETVATAESATAGSIASRIASVPGASQALMGGLVAYRADTKSALAGIEPGALARQGTVSAATTRDLALAARARTGADWGIGVTGVAGPDEVDGQMVGTCFWALAHPDGTCEVQERVISGDRGSIMLRLGSAALDLLRLRLLGDHGS